MKGKTMSNSDLKFIEAIRKQGKQAEDNLAICDLLHLIKMVTDGDLLHVDELNPQHIIDQQERIKKLERELFSVSRKARMEATNG